MSTACLSKSPQERARALAGVALLHILLGYAFVTGLRGDFAPAPAEALKLFQVAPEPPPPPVVPVPAARTHTPEGEAAPPSRKARPSPVVVPPPRIRLPAPPVLPVAPRATPVPPGSDSKAGVAAVDGLGSGTAGSGEGIGSGGQGSGAGSGGARRAERLSGRIANEDYPRAALRARAQGSVRVRYTVGVDGRVAGCTVTRSTAGPDLDALTCRLVRQRFRYRPATDPSGRLVPETLSRTYDWILPGGM